MTLRILAWCLLLIFSMALLAVAEPQHQPVPPYIPNGDDEHAGQPMFCLREDTKKYAANCTECSNECDKDGDEVETAGCKTYCRKGACTCHPPCQT